MSNSNYDNLISDRMNKHFDLSMPFGVVITWISAVVIYFSDIPNLFAWIDGIFGLILLTLYIIRNHIKHQHKIIVVIGMTLFLSVLFFMDGGFTSGAVTLMLICNGIAILLLSKKWSLTFGIITAICLTLLWIWAKWTGFTEPMDMNDGVWAIQWMMMFLYLFIFRKSAFAMRSYLVENIQGLEDSVLLANNLAYYDQLTSLPNQLQFMRWLEEKQKTEQLNGYIVIMSLANLNIINAVYGINKGDEVLYKIAKCFSNTRMDSEYIGRTGGNECAIWIPVDHLDLLKQRLSAYEEGLNQCFVENLTKNQLEYYVSYAYLDATEGTIFQCYEKATLAMTYAKFWKIRRFISYDQDFESMLVRENALKNQIRVDIMERRGFQVVYQPKYNALTNQVVGVEALARWHTELYGNISPIEFIRLVEEISMHGEFGHMILDQVLEDYPKLCGIYNHPVHVSINISPSFLMMKGFADLILEGVRAKNIPPGAIVLEVTENVMIEGKVEVNSILSLLRKQGIRISLDDFGTGYSALNYLVEMEVDELKIDKSLIDSILSNTKSYILLKTLISLTKAFDMDIVAEGVETKEQLDAVVSLGCAVIQGYYFGRPEPLERLR